MKHLKKIIIFSFFIILFIGVMYYILKPKYVNLDKYTWELIKGNTTVIKNPKGKIIVGPAIIIIQAQYPLIYGYSDSKFIINLEEDKIIFFKKKELWPFIKYLNSHSIKLNQQNFVTFEDVYFRAQHYSQYKATKLQNGIAGSGNKARDLQQGQAQQMSKKK